MSQADQRFWQRWLFWMIRAWQKVRKSFRFIRPGFNQYGYLKADTDSFRLKLPDSRRGVDSTVWSLWGMQFVMLLILYDVSYWGGFLLFCPPHLYHCGQIILCTDKYCGSSLTVISNRTEYLHSQYAKNQSKWLLHFTVYLCVTTTIVCLLLSAAKVAHTSYCEDRCC